MSDEQQADGGAGGGAPAPEVQARELGWKPKEEFQGNPENWVPADKYLERGETVLPYMQADRKRLFKKVDEQGAEIRRLSGALAESTEAINTLKQFTTSGALKEKDQEIVSLRRQLAEARRNGTPEQEVEVEAQLDTAKEERAALAAEVKAKPNGSGNGTGNGNGSGDPRARIQALAQTPEFQQFLADNPWYNEDSVARAAATAISGDIMQDPANRELSFADKLNLVAERTKARLGIGTPQRRGNSKVEGSRGGGGGGGGSSREPSYEALSAEAQAACDKQAKQVVGPNRAFKTMADWQKHYAKMVS
jgi:hypothetical protein